MEGLTGLRSLGAALPGLRPIPHGSSALANVVEGSSHSDAQPSNERSGAVYGSLSQPEPLLDGDVVAGSQAGERREP